MLQNLFYDLEKKTISEKTWMPKFVYFCNNVVMADFLYREIKSDYEFCKNQNLLFSCFRMIR